MSYNKQITIEASSNNKTSGENNIFTVNFPSLNIPRGATIQVSGSIIEEKGATNSSIIELQNTNISKEKEYISSYQGITINYYINNNGYQSVAMPLVYVNGYKISSGDTVYNKDIGAIKHNATLPILESYLGTPSQALNKDYTNYNRNFIEYQNSLNFANRDNRPPVSQANFLGDIIASPANVACGHTTVGPNGHKYILIDPSFDGPSGNVRIKAYTKNIEIDLKDTLLETPEEISYRVNTILQESTTNNDNNLVNVQTLPESYGDNTDDQDYKNVFNFSGTTLINIPANGQIPANIQVNGKYSKVIYSNMAVKNLNKWEGGIDWLHTTNPNVENGVEGIDFTTWEWAGANSEILRGGNSHIDQLKFYPAICGVSFNCYKASLNFSPEYNGQETNIAYGDNDIMITISNVNTDGNDLPQDFIYLVRIVIDLQSFYYFGRIEHNSNSNTLIGLELFNTTNLAPPNAQVLANPLRKYGFIHFPHSRYSTHLRLSLYDINENITSTKNYANITEDHQGNPINLQPTYYDDIIYNGLPYFYPGDSNSGGRLADHMEDTVNYDNKSNEYTAIPDGYIIPFNIKNTPSNKEKIKNFLKKNEFYIGNETEIKKIQEDTENWICQLDLGFCDTHLSTQSIYPYLGVNENETRGFRDHSANMSFYGEYYPNIISHFNNNNYSNDFGVINNKFIPYQIYPLNSASNYGSTVRSNRHNLFVYSRYHKNIVNKLKMCNENLSGASFLLNALTNSNDTSNGQVLEMTNRMMSAGHDPILGSISESIWKEDNCILIETEYNGILGLINQGICLVNARNTAQGEGLAVNYSHDIDSTTDFRTCGRICFGLNAGFDPAPIIPGSEFIIPMNEQQGNNSNTDVRKWDVTSYFPDNASNPTFSSYIEDYINSVFVGTTNAQLNFNGERFEFINLHTPRLFNADDSKATGINVGQQVAFFNESRTPI